ncbi:MAG: ATP-binding protein [Myxococcota bacterium]|nr:ATP-binding protein [Myxococcota bacterium]
MGLPLRLRIIAAFAFSFACFLAALTVGLWKLGDIGQGLRLLDEGYIPLSRSVSTMEASLVRLELDLDRSGGPMAGLRSNAQLHQRRISSGVQSGRQSIDEALLLPMDEVDLRSLEGLDLQLQVIAEYNQQLLDVSERWLDLMEAGRTHDAKALEPELVRTRGELETRVKQLARQVDGRIRGLADETAEAQRAALLASGSLALVALSLGLVMLALSVIALRPIGEMTRGVERIAGGDYSGRLDVQRDDELGVLSRRINEMAAAIAQRDEDLRRSAEQALSDQERLARAERLALVGQMLAQITHEVRNPLNAMSLNAELLAEEFEALPADRQAEAQEILETVTGEIERLEKTTEHYLTLARRPAPDLKPTDLADLVRSVARLLEQELLQAQVSLELDLAEGPPVEVDATQLRRAVLNVVKNALEAGARHVRVCLADTQEFLELRVEDDGPGLSPEAAERAFDPFYSTKAKGSGLGLAITRQILEDHGGTVAWSTLEPGTRIALRLPLGSWAPHAGRNRQSENIG